MIDSSAEQLSDATKQTAEIVLRAGEVRSSLKGLLERIQEASQNLGSASERVGTELSTQLSELNAQVSKIETSASGLSSAVEQLSAELVRRSNADSAQIEATKRSVEITGRELAGLTQIARATSDDIKTVRTAVDAIDGKAVEAIRLEIKPRIDESTQRTEAAVGTLDGLLGRRLATISATLDEIKQRSDGAGLGLIRFRGHFPKGGYDVQNGIKHNGTTSATTVHGGVQDGRGSAGVSSPPVCDGPRGHETQYTVGGAGAEVGPSLVLRALVLA